MELQNYLYHFFFWCVCNLNCGWGLWWLFVFSLVWEYVGGIGVCCLWIVQISFPIRKYAVFMLHCSPEMFRDVPEGWAVKMQMSAAFASDFFWKSASFSHFLCKVSRRFHSDIICECSTKSSGAFDVCLRADTVEQLLHSYIFPFQQLHAVVLFGATFSQSKSVLCR